MQFEDTIVAIATAYGTGAIGIVRISGKDTFDIVDKFFEAHNSKTILQQKHKTVNLGYISEEKIIIDEVLITKFVAPHSYTGENLVEISCHGSMLILNKIVQIAIRNGCRMAQPGEFTMRAFLSGKMDLSQAEAVADLIASKSEAARRVAVQQLRGGFSIELMHLRAKLVNFVSLIELELDFSEEDVEFASRNELFNLINEIENKLKKLLKSFEYGNALKNGINVAIVGEPNVGKSTLLNCLLNEEKAIVSEIAGTTRDSIEDTIVVDGILFRFIDTAGLRHTSDKIETMGIERSIEMIKKSEVVLYIVDAQNNVNSLLFDGIKQYFDTKKVIIVVNKIDKLQKDIVASIDKEYKVVEISAKNKINIEQLQNSLLESVQQGTYNQDDIIITNARHFEALQKSIEAAQRIVDAMENKVSTELLSFDIREMLHFLGEITGEVTNDEILGNIFKNFCIGK